MARVYNLILPLWGASDRQRFAVVTNVICKKRLKLIKVRFPFSHTLCKVNFPIRILTASMPIYLLCSLGLVLHDYFFPLEKSSRFRENCCAGFGSLFWIRTAQRSWYFCCALILTAFPSVKIYVKNIQKIQCRKTMIFKVKSLGKLLEKYSTRVWPLDASFSHRLLSSGPCSLQNKRICEAESETRYVRGHASRSCFLFRSFRFTAPLIRQFYRLQVLLTTSRRWFQPSLPLTR